MTDSQSKIITEGAAAVAASIAKLKRPIVFTNGCFDILHRGHVAYLEQAATLGRSVVVGVNDDSSVRSLRKEPSRPINSTVDRMAVLAALAVVDLVIPFSESTPLKLIQQIKPEHLVKGGDWKIPQIVGGDWVKEHGGQVHSIPFIHPHSTTEIISRIRETNDL